MWQCFCQWASRDMQTVIVTTYNQNRNCPDSTMLSRHKVTTKLQLLPNCPDSTIATIASAHHLFHKSLLVKHAEAWCSTECDIALSTNEP